MQHVYGLGEQFIVESPDGDWTGRVRSPGDDFGDQMVPFGSGAAGNARSSGDVRGGPGQRQLRLVP